MYRIKQIHYSPHYSHIFIQRRFFFVWWNMSVADVYRKNLKEAQRYVKLKARGFKVDTVYYD